MRLRKRFTWSLAGNATSAAGQWFLVVAISQLGDVAMLGRYGAGLAVCAPIVLLTNLGLRNAVATDTQREYAIADYRHARAAGALAAVVVLAVVVLARGDAARTTATIALVGGSKLIESLSDLSYGIFQRHGRNDLVARSMIARAALGLAAFTATLWQWRTLEHALVAMCLAWLAVLVAHDRPHTRLLEPEQAAPSSPGWAALIRATLPLGIVAALVSFGINIPRYAVDVFLDDAALGVFTAISYFLVVISVIVVAVAQATLTRLSQHWAAGEVARFRRLLATIVGACILLGMAGVLLAVVLGGPLLEVAFGQGFAPHRGLLVQTMAAAGISAVAGVLGVGAMATRRFAALLGPHLAAQAINLVTSFALVRAYGLAGAGWALIVAMVLSLAPPLLVLARAASHRRRATT